MFPVLVFMPAERVRVAGLVRLLVFARVRVPPALGPPRDVHACPHRRVLERQLPLAPTSAGSGASMRCRRPGERPLAGVSGAGLSAGKPSSSPLPNVGAGCP